MGWYRAKIGGNIVIVRDCVRKIARYEKYKTKKIGYNAEIRRRMQISSKLRQRSDYPHSFRRRVSIRWLFYLNSFSKRVQRFQSCSISGYVQKKGFNNISIMSGCYQTLTCLKEIIESTVKNGQANVNIIKIIKSIIRNIRERTWRMSTIYRRVYR